MIPPASFVSSVYCASPTSSRETSFESRPWSSSARRRALDLDLAHVRDVEDAGVGPHRPVLGDHALVLHRHLPAGERDEPPAGLDVLVVEGRAAKRLHRPRC